MIDYEDLLYTVFEYDDSVKTKEGEISKPMLGNKVYFEDICQQFNLTEDENVRKQGPTDPVKIGPKVR